MNTNTTTDFVPETDIIYIISILFVLVLSSIIYFMFYYFFGECVNMNRNVEDREVYLGVFMYICCGLVTVSIILIPLSFFIVYFNGFIIFGSSLFIAVIFAGFLIFYSAYVKRFKQNEPF